MTNTKIWQRPVKNCDTDIDRLVKWNEFTLKTKNK